MQSALTLAVDHAHQAGATRIHVLRLRVGCLSGVVPEALQFAYEALSAGTMAEKSKLEVENVAAVFWCAICQAEFTAECMFPECPKCHQPSGQVREGREMELASLEVE